MLLRSILNDCHKFKGFVYHSDRFEVRPNGQKVIVIDLRPRVASKGLCLICRSPYRCYAHTKKRRFRFIPLWGYPVEIHYPRRRLQCPTHGIKVEWLPWAEGKSPLTNVFKIYLAQWAKYLTWQTTAVLFGVTWQNVFAAVNYVVTYGLEHRSLDHIESIGIDEIYWLRNKYLTLVYQIDHHCRRLLYVGKGHSAKSLLRFFYRFGKARALALKAVCSDMWRPYLKVIARKAINAVNILDRFHIMKKFNEAIDDMRRQEARQLAKDGYEAILKNSRWCILKNVKNLTTSQVAKLKELVQYNLKTLKCRLLREAFQKFWSYQSATWAKTFLQQWTTRAMRCRLEPMKKVAKMLRAHEELILNWFAITPRLSNGIVEGLNNKAKLVMKRAYGFRYFKSVEVALYHELGELPMPPLTHRFL